MHFRSADYLGRHDCRAWVVRVAEQPLTYIIESLNYAAFA
ncbi:MAG: hypothetical protein QOJ06_52 [Pseudonocardiales bacterium]|jgi:hypothetical protein|nr:hypothetical protein [Pseudonocardiales bacterium]